ncbi:MAG: hypothetical protein JWR69_4755 [Pedosphaera sp.]|nr:hypothetical protein [Pedosphaera sp.]
MNEKRRILNTLLIAVWCILGAVLLAGCASPSTVAERKEQRAAEKAAKTPYGRLIAEGAAYLNWLTQQDKLPGIRRNDHGSIASAPEVLGEGAVTYPATVVFSLTKDRDPSAYEYTLLKPDPTAAWQLVKATRMDRNGRVLEDLLAK